jgi:predicted acetyltransferase
MKIIMIMKGYDNGKSKPFFITYQSEVVGFALLNTGKYTPKKIGYAE